MTLTCKRHRLYRSLVARVDDRKGQQNRQRRTGNSADEGGLLSLIARETKKKRKGRVLRVSLALPPPPCLWRFVKSMAAVPGKGDNSFTRMAASFLNDAYPCVAVFAVAGYIS